MGKTSFVLGIVSAFTCMTPLFGFVTTGFGIASGVKALRYLPYRDWKAVSGICLNAVFFLLSVRETVLGWMIIRSMWNII